MRNFACDLGAKMVQHMPAKWRHHCHCHPLRLVSLPPSLLPFFVAHVPLRYALEFHAFIRKDYEMRRVPAMFCMHFLWADAMAFSFPSFYFQLFSLSSSCLPLLFCTVCLSKCLLICLLAPTLPTEDIHAKVCGKQLGKTHTL